MRSYVFSDRTHHSVIGKLEVVNRILPVDPEVVACVQEVVCGGRTRLLRCDLEIGVDCSLATYSGVTPTAPKTACCQFYQAVRDSVCPMRGGGVKLLGRFMGSCPEVRSGTTPDP